MKPVAYMAGAYRAYFTGEHKYIPIAIDVSLVNMQWKDQIELFTGEQLRAAKISVLRKAALRMPGDYSHDALCRMADELNAPAKPDCIEPPLP